MTVKCSVPKAKQSRALPERGPDQNPARHSHESDPEVKVLGEIALDSLSKDALIEVTRRLYGIVGDTGRTKKAVYVAKLAAHPDQARVQAIVRDVVAHGTLRPFARPVAAPTTPKERRVDRYLAESIRPRTDEDRARSDRLKERIARSRAEQEKKDRARDERFLELCDKSKARIACTKLLAQLHLAGLLQIDGGELTTSMVDDLLRQYPKWHQS